MNFDLFNLDSNKLSWLYLIYTSVEQSQNLIEELCRKSNKLISNVLENSEDKDNIDLGEDILKRLCEFNLSYKVLYDIIDSSLKKVDSVLVGVEGVYIDRIHRDSYYSHYSENHTEISRYCKRLLLFADEKHCLDTDDDSQLQKNFIGSIVIRPLNNGIIGRTLLNPYFILDSNEKYYIRTSEWIVSCFGKSLKVRAFPFLTQDRVTTTCAETSILIIMDYYSKQYTDYRFAVPSDISKIAEKETCSRVIPSYGLSYQVISKILCEFGFYTDLKMYSKDSDNIKMRSYLYYYIESGMPVCVNMATESDRGHSAVFIGHENVSLAKIMSSKLQCYNGKYCVSTALGCQSFVAMDDNVHPYSIYTFNDCRKNNKLVRRINRNGNSQLFMEVECFIAPLHKRMYMDARRAEDVVVSILKKSEFNPCFVPEFYLKQKMNKWGKRDNPLIYRLFLASSRHLKQWRIKTSNAPKAFKAYYSNMDLPQFVWVCEFYDSNGYKNKEAKGELVIDATMCPTDSMIDSILMMNYTCYGFYYSKSIDGKILKQYHDTDYDNDINEERGLVEAGKEYCFKLSSYSQNLMEPKECLNK